MKTVEEAAKQMRDDDLLRAISKRRRTAEDKKIVVDSGVAKELRSQAEHERQQNIKQREERKAAEREAGLSAAEAARRVEEAKAEAARERRRTLEAATLARQQEDKRKADLAAAREKAKFLECEYPLRLADRLLAWRNGLAADDLELLRERVLYLARTDRVINNTVVPRWWVPACPPFTRKIGTILGPDRNRHVCLATPDFEWMLYKKKWAAACPFNAPQHQLYKLFDALVPDASKMLGRRHTVELLLHNNDYIMEKAFVHGIFLISRWLRPEWCPDGLFNWPPPIP